MPRLALLTVLFAAGCGSSAIPMPDYGSDEGLKIAQLVSEFNDTRGAPAKFKTMFAAAPPAAGLKAYEKYVYEVEVSSPRVDGTTATATVRLLKEADNSLVTTKEWTFAKVGDAWKIKTAPLP
ncbi:MAG TPA: hypothetical protein VD866_20370 [Urbifossiella sp.]|nr:hypothetical protein [Urbifossiella sp.]